MSPVISSVSPLTTTSPPWKMEAMFSATLLVAEDKILRALKEGKFDDLEGMGKPLPADEAENLPPELRMAYRILKSGGYITDQTQQQRDIKQAVDLLEAMDDEQERYRQMQKLNVMVLKMERQGKTLNIDGDDGYYRRVVEKVRLAGTGSKR